MRQTLAVSVTFAIFGDGSRLLQETDSLKTTQMLQHWVIPPDLVRVTACEKQGVSGGEELSWPLCFGGVGRRRPSGWGREG